MTSKELDRFFAEDFYNIIVKIQPENRGIYLLLVAVFSLMINLLFVISMAIGEFIL